MSRFSITRISWEHLLCLLLILLLSKVPNYLSNTMSMCLKACKRDLIKVSAKSPKVAACWKIPMAKTSACASTTSVALSLRSVAVKAPWTEQLPSTLNADCRLLLQEQEGWVSVHASRSWGGPPWPCFKGGDQSLKNSSDCLDCFLCSSLHIVLAHVKGLFFGSVSWNFTFLS